MEDKIQPYRQSMVTATGILLGFILNFSSVWTSKAFSNNRIKEIVIAISLCICIPLLITVLYRILRYNVPAEKAERFYNKTLLIFISALSAVFLAILITLIESAIKNSQ